MPTNLNLLKHQIVTIAGVRFLGVTLWTDFRLRGQAGADRAAAPRSPADFVHMPSVQGADRLLPWHLTGLHRAMMCTGRCAASRPFRQSRTRTARAASSST